LRVLRELEPRFRAQNVALIGISSDAPDVLQSAYKSYSRTQSLPFVLLADGDLKAFKAFGCWDGDAQHGTFVLDAKSRVIWQNVSPQPFMDLQDVLKQCQTPPKPSAQVTKIN
jgi:peroxiredoxin